MKTTRVAIFGHGIIGGGVSRILLNDRVSIRQRTGVDLELAAICTLDPEADPEIYNTHRQLFRDAREVLSDPSIQVISETIGGNGIALEFVKEALVLGKDVVTANKKLIAISYQELSRLAAKHNRQLLFEAAVGGGIPLLSTISDGLAGDTLIKIEGILNGTTNYILTKMAAEEVGFDDALSEAQKLGYAEADPTDDIEAFDAAYKLSILCALVFKKFVHPDKIARTGITGLRMEDLNYAKYLGGTIKLLALAQQEDRGLSAQVSPVLLIGDSPLASTDGVLNAIRLVGKYNSDGNFLSGAGAGRYATAAAIVSDLIAVAKGEAPSRQPLQQEDTLLVPDQAYYLRFVVHDRPGILGEVCTIFGKHGISLDAVGQVGQQSSEATHFALTTRPVKNSDFEVAYTEIARMPFNALPPFVLPVR